MSSNNKKSGCDKYEKTVSFSSVKPNDNRIEVISYSGYREEETPRFILIHEEKIEVNAILDRWIEERLNDRATKRYFRVKGSDGKIHIIYYDEKDSEWFYRVPD